MEKTIEQKAAELDAAIKEAKSLKADYEAKIKELEAKGDSTKEVAELKAAIESKDKDLDQLKTAVSEFEKKMNTMSMQPKNEVKSFGEAIADVLNSDEFKQGATDTINGKRASFKTEVKSVTLASVTNPITTTMMRSGLEYLPQGETPLLNLAVQHTIPAGKNKIGYIDADFTSNTGYVTELAAMASSQESSLSATEKTVEISKIGTYMKYSAEFVQDNSTVLNWAQSEALQGLMIGLEGKLLAGLGDDSTKKNEIRGLDLYSTAFDSDVATITTANPNLIDLIMAMKLQIRKQSVGKYLPTHVLMSADDVAELEAAKDANLNPLQYRNMVINSDGTIRIAGLQVIESITLTKGTFYAITQRVWELYSSRGFEVEIERVASTDSYVLYIRWRGQSLITNKGKLGIVKATTANLADITTVVEED